MKAAKFTLPIIVLLLAGVVCYIVVALKPQPERVEPTVVAPTVEFIQVQPESVQLKVRSQGTVPPRTETTLTAEV
ncbi:MAG: efflux RND transporter periplasmic adaptor subunit, partial [Puniceicoccales bacterium]